MGSDEPIFNKVLPSKDSTLPFWRIELHELDTHRSTPGLPTTCDILIIGAGYAGITAAYHILNSIGSKHSKPSIVLAEARQACSGATARNGGHLRPSVAGLLPSYIKLYRSKPQLKSLPSRMRMWTSFDVFTDPEKAEAAREAFYELLRIGVARSTMEGIAWTDSDRAEEVSGVRGAVGCFSFKAAHLWPYKLVMHLLSVAVSKGLNLQTNTPILSLSQSTTAGAWTATTDRGTITTPKVIVTTNGYTAGLLPEYAGKIVPARGICSHIIVPPGSKHPLLTCTHGLRLPGLGYDYLIPRNDGSIIVGGGQSTFRMHREQWHNVTDDSTLIKVAENYFDGFIQQNFIGWEDSEATLDRVWTGIMGYNADSLPSIGEVPGRTGCYIEAGFEGHGMPAIFLAMKGIAKMVVEGMKYEGAGLPIVYKTTEERLNNTMDDTA